MFAAKFIAVIVCALAVANAAPLEKEMKGHKVASSNFGSCQNPTIKFQSGKFVTANQKDFNHVGNAKIEPVATAICNNLAKSCKANAATIKACTGAMTEVKKSKLKGQDLAKLFNTKLGAKKSKQAGGMPTKKPTKGDKPAHSKKPSTKPTGSVLPSGPASSIPSDSASVPVVTAAPSSGPADSTLPSGSASASGSANSGLPTPVDATPAGSAGPDAATPVASGSSAAPTGSSASESLPASAATPVSSGSTAPTPSAV